MLEKLILTSIWLVCWLNVGERRHTFHFPHGEATITLQDVVLQLGLKIDGLSVTGFITGDVRVALLRETPPDKYVKGKMIYLTWLRQKFQQLTIDADDVVIA